MAAYKVKNSALNRITTLQLNTLYSVPFLFTDYSKKKNEMFLNMQLEFSIIATHMATVLTDVMGGQRPHHHRCIPHLRAILNGHQCC